MIVTPDKSIVGQGGKFLFFSLRRFVMDICEGNCCFICGRDYDEAEFNDEHILPNWILRKHNLHSKQITLPNRATRLYGTYKIPCCQPCNSLMAAEFETPISELVAQGYSAVVDYVREGGYWKIFQWLNLIFLKTHLKDRSFSFELDVRRGAEKISDKFSWADLHHIHCIARSFHTGATINPKALGSFFLLPVKAFDGDEEFDFRDLTFAQTMLLRLGEIAFIVVLNDSCAAWNILRESLNRIEGPLSLLQLREFMALAASFNVRLKERPVFYTSTNSPGSDLEITADLPPSLEFEPYEPSEFGKLLYFNVEDIVPAFSRMQDIEQIKEHIRGGRWTFLFDKEGNFIKNSMEPRE
jgi:hypothetical protein